MIKFPSENQLKKKSCERPLRVKHRGLQVHQASFQEAPIKILNPVRTENKRRIAAGRTSECSHNNVWNKITSMSGSVVPTHFLPSTKTLHILSVRLDFSFLLIAKLFSQHLSLHTFISTLFQPEKTHNERNTEMAIRGVC
ncbi:hypothetical protein AMECASPLE_031963 [Ameca splendens]|uniref:Uncharacterized protein n=1 Tax=Ameca splendens TaxID=208324 RepID=A0ABV0Z4M9_9TELE